MKRYEAIPHNARFLFANAIMLSLCALFLAGCASAPKPLSPETSALAQYWNATGIRYPASAPLAEKTAWEVGQYVMTGTLENGKLTALSRILIAGKENGGWIVEMDFADKRGKGSGFQLFITGLDEAIAAHDPSKMRLGWVKTQDNKNKVTKLEGKLTEPYATYADELYRTFTLTAGDVISGGTVAVPAGIFEGTFLQKTTAADAGNNPGSDKWYHTAIPVNGLVKRWSTDGKTVTEVLSFGTDGQAMIK